MGSWPVVYEELLRCNWAKRSSKKYLTCCTETPAPWQLRFFSATVITPLRTASITNFPCCHSTGCTEIFPNREVPHTFQQKQCGSMRCLPDSSHRRYRSILVFGTPEDKWATWVSPLFPAFTYMLHSTVERVLNGPNIRDLRATDANMHMYSALTLQSFNRGHPMVPQSKPCEDSVTVAAGEHLGLVSWTRFKPHEKFHLSEYMRDLTERLGHQLQTYGVMDGRKLVRYQCVVVRQQWDELRTPFFEAFQVQKAAYRRANGGTTAPSLVEDAAPRFVLRHFSCCAQPVGIKTIVRKTFIELDEGSDHSAGCLKRSNSTGEVLAYCV